MAETININEGTGSDVSTGAATAGASDSNNSSSGNSGGGVDWSIVLLIGGVAVVGYLIYQYSVSSKIASTALTPEQQQELQQQQAAAAANQSAAAKLASGIGAAVLAAAGAVGKAVTSTAKKAAAPVKKAINNWDAVSTSPTDANGGYYETYSDGTTHYFDVDGDDIGQVTISGTGDDKIATLNLGNGGYTEIDSNGNAVQYNQQGDALGPATFSGSGADVEVNTPDGNGGLYMTNTDGVVEQQDADGNVLGTVIGGLGTDDEVVMSAVDPTTNTYQEYYTDGTQADFDISGNQIGEPYIPTDPSVTIDNTDFYAGS